MKNVLIVDDEKRIRKIYRKMMGALRLNDLRILEAENAEQATDFLIKERIHMILLDIQMPEIDGQYMSEVIREHNPNIKVVVTSVYPVEEQRRRIPFATDYHDKSENIVQFLDRVIKLLTEEPEK